MIDQITVSIRNGSVCLEISELHQLVYVLNRITNEEKTYVEFHEWYGEEWPKLEKFFKSDKGQEFLLDVYRRAFVFRKFLDDEYDVYGDGIALALLVLSRGMINEINKELDKNGQE